MSTGQQDKFEAWKDLTKPLETSENDFARSVTNINFLTHTSARLKSKNERKKFGKTYGIHIAAAEAIDDHHDLVFAGRLQETTYTVMCDGKFHRISVKSGGSITFHNHKMPELAAQAFVLEEIITASRLRRGGSWGRTRIAEMPYGQVFAGDVDGIKFCGCAHVYLRLKQRLALQETTMKGDLGANKVVSEAASFGLTRKKEKSEFTRKNLCVDPSNSMAPIPAVLAEMRVGSFEGVELADRNRRLAIMRFAALQKFRELVKADFYRASKAKTIGGETRYSFAISGAHNFKAEGKSVVTWRRHLSGRNAFYTVQIPHDWAKVYNAGLATVDGVFVLKVGPRKGTKQRFIGIRQGKGFTIYPCAGFIMRKPDGRLKVRWETDSESLARRARIRAGDTALLTFCASLPDSEPPETPEDVALDTLEKDEQEV